MTAPYHVSPVQDWTTDTASLRAALASGRPVLLDAGDFYLEGDGTEILKKTDALPFIGMGMGSGGTRLVVRSTVPNTRDVIRLVPTQQDSRGLDMGHFSIRGEGGGRYGRDGIRIDLSDPAATFLAQTTFSRIETWDVNGKSWNLVNPSKMDGLFTTKWVGCEWWDGAYFQRIGDSIQFEKCVSAGRNCGIEIASMVTGANVVRIHDHNSTASGGAIKFNGLRLHVDGLNAELFSNPGTIAAVVEFTGNSSPYGKDVGSSIRNAQVYAFSGTNADALRLSGTIERFTVGAGCHLQAISPRKDLTIGASCSYTTIERGVSLEQGAGGLSDGGSNTLNSI